MFTEGSRSNSKAESNQLMYCMTIPRRKHFAISDTLLDDNGNHENTLWIDIGIKLTSINTNSSKHTINLGNWIYYVMTVTTDLGKHHRVGQYDFTDTQLSATKI
jgi:hypothetical protein